MEFIDLLNHRASVRSYTYAPVTNGQVEDLLLAGIRAPNACNMQSWYFYAVLDKEKIEGSHGLVSHIPWAKDVPLIIIVCIREEIAGELCQRFGERGRAFCEHDAAGAINNILLKAADMGLGGCWIGPMNQEKCKSHFNIAKNHTPTAILTIGTPASEVRIRDRKPLNESVTYVGAASSAAKTPEEKPFKLEHASLPGATFEDLNLAGAKFNNINLQGAKFSDINMRNVLINDVALDGCKINGLDLTEIIKFYLDLKN